MKAYILLLWQGFVRFIAISVFGAFAVGMPAVANGQAFNGQDIDDIAELTFHSGWRAGNRHIFALELTLKDGWKTYWRDPGEAGIATDIKIHGRGVKIDTISWPVPEIFTTSGFRSIGYSKKVILPIIVQIAKGEETKRSAIRGRVQLGLCKDVCIPASLPFSGSLPSSAAISNAIALAMRNGPTRFAQPASCTTYPAQDSLILEARLPVEGLSRDAVIVVEPNDPDLTARPAEIIDIGETAITIRTLLQRRDRGYIFFERSAVLFTILEKGQGFELAGCKMAAN